jgi:hypothetical protein
MDGPGSRGNGAREDNAPCTALDRSNPPRNASAKLLHGAPGAAAYSEGPGQHRLLCREANVTA